MSRVRGASPYLMSESKPGSGCTAFTLRLQRAGAGMARWDSCVSPTDLRNRIRSVQLAVGLTRAEAWHGGLGETGQIRSKSRVGRAKRSPTDEAPRWVRRCAPLSNLPLINEFFEAFECLHQDGSGYRVPGLFNTMEPGMSINLIPPASAEPARFSRSSRGWTGPRRTCPSWRH